MFEDIEPNTNKLITGYDFLLRLDKDLINKPEGDYVKDTHNVINMLRGLVKTVRLNSGDINDLLLFISPPSHDCEKGELTFSLIHESDLVTINMFFNDIGLDKPILIIKLASLETSLICH